MIFGGIPYYLNLFEKGLSFSKNVDKLCFAEKAALQNEFEDLYMSLFDNPCRHYEEKNGAYYYLKDPFTLFYLRYMKGNQTRDEYF